MKRSIAFLLLVLALINTGHGADLAQGFIHPPDSARPWVFWFWVNGNITSNGITADLEAMQRSGLGGVLIMEVDVKQGAPKGPATFGSPPWRALFQHACAEAHRLGLQINMSNDAGWSGSGGPWVTPDLAMQKVVWTETPVEGPRRFDGELPQPKATWDFYRDIAVFALPAPADDTRINAIRMKAAFVSKPVGPRASWPALSVDQTISRGQIVELTSRLDKNGHLIWDVPEGKWTLLRMGYTPTGKENHPAPKAGLGPECDKLNAKAMDVMFNGLMAKLIADAGPLAGKTLVSTHIDSWEIGSQNWTPRFRKEFRRLRGYDPLPLLPVMTGRVVDNLELSERFLWDLRQTISDLMLTNYAGHLRELAHRHGLRLSIEAYNDCLADEMAYAGRADEPMGEFWNFGKYGEAYSCTEMASAAHVYGRRIVGAEAFTSSKGESWLAHPGNIKDVGDWAFCEGINRFVIHRYAMQPWSDVRPGMSMGPWGLHYERTQTWWEQSRPWHDYLTRCQFLLQQGLFVADLCLLGPEGSPQSLNGQPSFMIPSDRSRRKPRERSGYSYDTCPPEVLLTRMSVKDGRIVLPDGMSYRLLVLPRIETMTPQLLRKVRDLIQAGATVVGARPLKSPSLADYPRCDQQVKELADELWGGEPLPSGWTERRFGKGAILCSSELEKARTPDPEARNPFSAAKWIWHSENPPALAAPPGPRYFRRLVTLAPEARIESAQLFIAADNYYECWVNGERVASGSNLSFPGIPDVTTLLRPGDNIIAASVLNEGDSPSPAGLLASLQVKFQDGRTLELHTDTSWQSAESVRDSWKQDAKDESAWHPTRELGRFGMEPWGEIVPRLPYPSVFTDLDVLEDLLAKRGVPPDFAFRTADRSQFLRYIHRTIGRTDIYFVANRDPQPADAVCSFRIQGRRPEFWWPDTGRTDRPAVYNQTEGSVQVPLHLEPYGSVFVVFRENAPIEPDRITSIHYNSKPLVDTSWPKSQTTASAKGDPLKLVRGQHNTLEALAWEPGTYRLNSAKGESHCLEVASLPAPLEITGPWQVRFAPGWGAPEHLTFNKLISWSDHNHPGVKYFSGAATYSKTFEVSSSLLSKGQHLFLDLGKVQVMADVKLNGQSLGILWKPPFRVEVTEAVKPGANNLEIKIVNLWVNRQIGDELLPEDSERRPDSTLKQWPQWLQEGKPSPADRFTFTTWRLWSKDSPLQESGLLGPVKILSSKQISLRDLSKSNQ